MTDDTIASATLLQSLNVVLMLNAASIVHVGGINLIFWTENDIYICLGAS